MGYPVISLADIKRLRSKWRSRLKMNPTDSADQRFYDGFACGLEYAIKDLEAIESEDEPNTEKSGAPAK